MALPSAGAISMANINTQLGYSTTATVSFNDTAVRKLGSPNPPDGVLGNPISMSNFYGRLSPSASKTTVSAYSSGVYFGSDPGTGPEQQPGYIYNTTQSASAYVGIAYCSQYYQSVAQQSQGGNDAYDRTLAFCHPYTTISDAQFAAWGFAPTQVMRATGIALTYINVHVNAYFVVGYAIMTAGSALGSYSNQTALQSVSDPSYDRNWRSWSGSVAVPDPATNQVIFIYSADSIGTDSRTIQLQYTSYS